MYPRKILDIQFEVLGTDGHWLKAALRREAGRWVRLAGGRQPLCWWLLVPTSLLSTLHSPREGNGGDEEARMSSQGLELIGFGKCQMWLSPASLFWGSCHHLLRG